MTGRWLLSGGAVAAAALLVALRPPAVAEPAASAPAPRILPVGAVAIEPADSYDVPRTWTGLVRARRGAALGFELDGKLELVRVDEGDRVEAGEVLARLEDRRVRAARDAAAADLAEARAALDEMLAGPRAQTLDAARARVRELESESELARSRRERREDLLLKDAVSEEVRDTALRDERAVEARLDAAREVLDELEEGTRAEVVAAQRARVARLEAQLDAAEADLEDTVLVAPFAGTIARRDRDEGAVVSAGSPVLRLVESEALEAKVGVPVAVAARLAAGDVLALRVGSRELEGRVRSLMPELDGATRTSGVLLDLPSGSALPGEAARLELTETVPVQGYWLPVTALTRGTRGLWASYALVPLYDEVYRVERRDVEVLYTDGDRVLVRGTLKGGERVLPEGLHRVVPEQTVRLVDGL